MNNGIKKESSLINALHFLCDSFIIKANLQPFFFIELKKMLVCTRMFSRNVMLQIDKYCLRLNKCKRRLFI